MKKLIIIGAGVAGLSAGIYGRLNGFDTEVYEMHTAPGGECTGWKRGDYYFDGCIHWLMGSANGNALNQMWRQVGALNDSVKIINNDIFYCFEKDEKKVFLYRDAEKLRAHLKEISPEDTPQIDELCKAMKAMRSMSMPVAKPMEMMNAADIAKMIVKMMPAMKYAGALEKITVKEYADKFRSPLIKEAFSVLIPPYFKATALVATLSSLSSGDSGWPEGGSLPFAKRIEARYVALGGKISYRSPVEKILTENGEAVGILLKDGTKKLADYVVSAADGHETLYRLLDGKYVDEQQKAMYEDGEAYPVYTSVQVSLGIDADLSAYPHTLHFEPEKSIAGGGAENKRLGVKHFCYDKTLNPKGKSSITVMLNADFDWWKNLSDDREAYRREKERIGREVGAVVENRYPEAKGKIEVVDVATPMTYVRYCKAWKGAWMAFGMTPKGKVRFLTGILPGLSRFYHCGQWTMLPGGLPTAVVTGKWAIERICKKEKKKFIAVR